MRRDEEFLQHRIAKRALSTILKLQSHAKGGINSVERFQCSLTHRVAMVTDAAGTSIADPCR